MSNGKKPKKPKSEDKLTKAEKKRIKEKRKFNQASMSVVGGIKASGALVGMKRR